MKAIFLFFVLAVASISAQTAAQLQEYEGYAAMALAAYPEAGEAGSAMNSKMEKIHARLESEGSRVINSTFKPLLIAAGAANELAEEKDPAAPLPAEVTARCMLWVKANFGDCSEPSKSAFATAFWQCVPRAVEQKITGPAGVWPLLAARDAAAKLRGQAAAAARHAPTGPAVGSPEAAIAAGLRPGLFQNWTKTKNNEPVTWINTGPGVWVGSDGATAIQTAPGQVQINR